MPVNAENDSMKKIFCLLALSLFLMSCKKEKAEQCIDTMVFWGGDPAADGMGWYLADSRGSATTYSVDNLPARFEKDSTPVRVCLKRTDKKRSCYCINPPFVYHIESISGR